MKHVNKPYHIHNLQRLSVPVYNKHEHKQYSGRTANDNPYNFAEDTEIVCKY